MGELKTTFKEGICFPKYCIFFLKEILDSIKEEDLQKGEILELEIHSQYPYFFDGLNLVKKTLERKGFKIKFPTYIKKEDVAYYKWEISYKL